MMTFDVNTSQQEQRVTTSDRKWNLLQSPWNHVKHVTLCWFAHALPAGVNLSRIRSEFHEHEIYKKSPYVLLLLSEFLCTRFYNVSLL